MPRILVADDNSNIQKMVVLALKDEGVDIVSVGNGEAAVRKIPEAAPDLILADIFMPVRSGYEVCEFVKNDSRYMHIPVVLLVGAFDPLDEHEAQRVHADGVLKKPFVPPEPLVNMVRALLQKAAEERLIAVAVPAMASSVGAEIAHPKSAAVGTLAPVRIESRAVQQEELPDLDFPELPSIEPSSPNSHLSLGDESRASDALAFSSLLETPEKETSALDSNDPIVTSERDPILGEPAFWSAKTSERPAEAEDSDDADDSALEHPWQRKEILPSLAGAVAQAPAPASFVHETVFDEVASSHATGPVESLAAVQPATGAIESLPEESSSAITDFAWSPSDADFAEAHHAEIALPPAFAPAGDLSQVQPEAEPEVLTDLQPQFQSEVQPEVQQEMHSDEPDLAWAAVPQAALSDAASPSPVVSSSGTWEPPAAAVTAEAPDPMAEHAAVPTEFPAVHSDQDDVAREATRQVLEKYKPRASSDYDADDWPPVFRPVTEAVSNIVSEAAKQPQTPEAAPEQPALQAFSQTSAPAAQPSEQVGWGAESSEVIPNGGIAHDGHGTWPSVPGDLATVSHVSQHEQHISELRPPAGASPEEIEAIVTRIVDRMQPKVIEMVTREILRPVVEALVRREIDKR